MGIGIDVKGIGEAAGSLVSGIGSLINTIKGTVSPDKLIRDRFSKLHNIQNRGDIVTMVPFGVMGFCHVGDVMHVGPPHAPWYTPHLIPQYLSSLA
jgi:hypothetical protein